MSTTNPQPESPEVKGPKDGLNFNDWDLIQDGDDRKYVAINDAEGAPIKVTHTAGPYAGRTTGVQVVGRLLTTESVKQKRENDAGEMVEQLTTYYLLRALIPLWIQTKEKKEPHLCAPGDLVYLNKRHQLTKLDRILDMDEYANVAVTFVKIVKIPGKTPPRKVWQIDIKGQLTGQAKAFQIPANVPVVEETEEAEMAREDGEEIPF